MWSVDFVKHKCVRKINMLKMLSKLTQCHVSDQSSPTCCHVRARHCPLKHGYTSIPTQPQTLPAAVAVFTLSSSLWGCQSAPTDYQDVR